MLDTLQVYAPYGDAQFAPHFTQLKPIYNNPLSQVIVYRAMYSEYIGAPCEPVALKVVQRDSIDVGTAHDQRARDEIEALSKLDHPNVVRVLEAGATDHYFLAMEYIDMTLAARIDMGRDDPQTKMTLPSVIAKIYQVACALAYCHAHGIIHRDVKTDNIYIDLTVVEGLYQRAILGDFSIALNRSAGSRVTGDEIIGTCAYMAPEQFYGEATAQSDIYSLGAVMYECITGDLLWPDAGQWGVGRFEEKRHKEPPNIADVCPDLPAYIASFLNSLIANDPRKRPANAYVVCLQLRDIFRALRDEKRMSLRSSSPLKALARGHYTTIVGRGLPRAFEEDRICLGCRGTGESCAFCHGDGYVRDVPLRARHMRQRWITLLIGEAIAAAILMLTALYVIAHYFYR